MRRIEEYWVIFDDDAQEEPKGFISALFDGVDSVRNAILAVFVIFTFVFRAVGVDGSSWCLPCTTATGWRCAAL